MPSRKGTQRNTRSLTKTSHGSFSITLPIDLIRSLGWRPRQKLTVTPKGKKLVVKDESGKMHLVKVAKCTWGVI